MADGAGGVDGDHAARVTGKRSDTTRRPSAKFLSTGFGQQVRFFDFAIVPFRERTPRPRFDQASRACF